MRKIYLLAICIFIFSCNKIESTQDTNVSSNKNVNQNKYAYITIQLQGGRLTGDRFFQSGIIEVTPQQQSVDGYKHKLMDEFESNISTRIHMDEKITNRDIKEFNSYAEASEARFKSKINSKPSANNSKNEEVDSIMVEMDSAWLTSDSEKL